MVGRRLMLTAAHCVNWKNDNEIGWLKFTPSYYNGEAPFGVACATKVIYWEKPDASDGLSDHETAFDYVIAVLDRNMGDVTGYTGYKTYSSTVEQPQGMAKHRISRPIDVRQTSRDFVWWCHHVGPI
jgi:V8-like Glu-specific endopeptidase